MIFLMMNLLVGCGCIHLASRCRVCHGGCCELVLHDMLFSKQALARTIEFITEWFTFCMKRVRSECCPILCNARYSAFRNARKMKFHTKNKAIYKQIAGLLLGKGRISW